MRATRAKATFSRRQVKRGMERLLNGLKDSGDPLFTPLSVGFYKPTKAELRFVRRRKIRIPVK